MRLKILNIIFAGFTCVILCTLFYLQVIRGNYYYELGKSNCIRLITQKAKRGTIYDRNGVVVADNKPSFDVVAIPQELKDADSSFDYLSRLLGKNKEELLRKFNLGRWAPFAPVVVVRNISREEAIRLEENKDNAPGIEIEINAQRFYPLGEATSHLLGYIGQIDRFRITRLKDYGYKIKDMVGYSGVEEYYDNFLRGEDGGTQVEVDNRGRQVRMLGARAPKQGRNVTLTIDSRMQKIAYNLLEGKKGAIIFMDPRDGEILCLVSSPAFSPNVFIERDNDALINSYFRDSSAPLLNRAIKGLYAPGSVFKVITMLSALETGKITPATSFFCNGHFFLGAHEFSCWEAHGLQDLRQAVVHSCDVFFYHLGLMAGPDLLNKYAKEFGLGSLTLIDLPAESKGQVSSRMLKKMTRNETWYNGDTVNFSIGQGDLLVTPIQMVKMMALVVSENMGIRPHVVKKVADKEILYKASESKLKIKSDSLEKARSYLRAVVQDNTGTAHILEIEKLGIAGKTGTVQVAKGKPHAWFVGYFPQGQPQLVFCVFLENGGSSSNACVIARQMFEEMLQQKIL